MSHRWPSPGIVLIVTVSAAVFLALPAWAFGGIRPLLAHPARAAVCGIVTLAMLACLFTDINLRGFQHRVARRRWLLLPFLLFTLLLAGLPAYSDRRDFAVLDGDVVRYLGLVLFTAGCVLRVGPMFVLGQRFTWPLATQEQHQLTTTGFYRVIRHPSYLGALLGGIGWALVFRSAPGLMLMLPLIAGFGGIIHQEESLLLAEFGEAYAAYQQRTWRLVPFVY